MAKHRRPGLFAVLAMGCMLVLSHGVPGLAEQSPSEEYVENSITRMLEADSKITIIADEGTTERAPAKRHRHDEGRRTRRYKKRPFVRDYRPIAYKAAVQAGIRRPQLFVRQIAAESGFQPCARSGAGALGIAQIMPATARSWKVDPFTPESALRVAAKHMAIYERQYGSYKLALAAYNAGPGAVAAYGGVPPYAETRGYVHRIMHRNEAVLGMNQVYRLPPGLQSGFAHKLKLLRKAVRRHGGRMVVEEGWRPYPEQMRLWRQAKKRYGGWTGARKWVAPPGCSNHNRGWAADVSGSLNLAHRLAPRFGLVFPMSHEPWHVELAGIPTQSG